MSKENFLIAMQHIRHMLMVMIAINGGIVIFSCSKAPKKKYIPYGLRKVVIEGMARKLPSNSLKTQKMHFLPVFELMTDSLTTI